MTCERISIRIHSMICIPDQTWSPATFAKAYLGAMGITPPSQKFALPPWVLGVAMQAYYGGRAECRIRHTFVPTVYTDCLSQYPTVNTLMGLFSFLIAERLEIQEATRDVRCLLARVSVDAVLNPAFWKGLTFFALVQPDGDVLPVRTTYNDATSNIGVNPLTSARPIWYAGPDLVNATLQTGRPPKVLRAVRVVPVGQQSGLKSVRLREAIEIDPRTDDFFKKAVEARALAKVDTRLSEAERSALRLFLKILVNAGSYGLFVESIRNAAARIQKRADQNEPECGCGPAIRALRQPRRSPSDPAPGTVRCWRHSSQRAGDCCLEQSNVKSRMRAAVT